SRRPAESAASSTRPAKPLRKVSSGANGCSARTSMRSSRGAVVGKLRTAAPPPESSVSALKASSVIDAKAPRAASSSAGGRNNSAGESTGRSMSWRRSSWRASTSCHPLASEEQPHPRQRIEGALGLRVEAPDGLDLVVEQVDAQRSSAAHGKDVEERPAHRELPGTHDLADTRVAGFREALAEGLDGKRL